jgi:hypothetical protein
VASWHALQVAVEVAYPEFDVSFPSDDDVIFSDGTFASRARPAMILPLAAVKDTPSLSESAGQVILELSEIGDPQQYVDIPFLKWTLLIEAPPVGLEFSKYYNQHSFHRFGFCAFVLGGYELLQCAVHPVQTLLVHAPRDQT